MQALHAFQVARYRFSLSANSVCSCSRLRSGKRLYLNAIAAQSNGLTIIIYIYILVENPAKLSRRNGRIVARAPAVSRLCRIALMSDRSCVLTS